MKICILEPYFSGSHADWAKSYQKHSQHEVHILSLAGCHWKWRMHGGAITLAREFLALEEEFDVLLASDMLDLTTFLSLTRQKTANLPVAFFFSRKPNRLSLV